MNLDVKIAAVFLSYLLNIDLISDKICGFSHTYTDSLGKLYLKTIERKNI